MNPRDLIDFVRSGLAADIITNPARVAALCDALEQALDRDDTSETALRQRLVELEHLRGRVTDLQEACTRHEREARIARARGALWKADRDELVAECDYEDARDVDDAACERANASRGRARREAEEARRALESYGATL